jgi:hypothetical protein
VVIGGKNPKPPRVASDLYFVKGFTSRSPLVNPQSAERFYDLWSKLDSEYKSYNKLADAGDVSEASKLSQKYNDIEVVHKILGRANGRIKEIDDEIDNVPTQVKGDKEQRAKLNELYLERLEIYRLANKVMQGKAEASELKDRGMTKEPKTRNPYAPQPPKPYTYSPLRR